MTNYLKWGVPGGAALLIFGVLIGAKLVSAPAKSTSPVASAGIERSESQPQLTLASYPKPQVSITSRKLRSHEVTFETRGASFYDPSFGNDSYLSLSKPSRHHHHKTKKAKPVQSAGIDPDMGLMAADDSKLQAAEHQLEKQETAGYKDWGSAGPEGH